MLAPTRPKNGTREQLERYNKELSRYNIEKKAQRARETGFAPKDDPKEVARRYKRHQEEFLIRKEEEAELKDAARKRAQAAYDEKMGRTGFRKINDTLIKIADAGVNLPFVPGVVKMVYEKLGPRAQGYEGGSGESGPSISSEVGYSLSGKDMQKLLPNARLYTFKDLRNLESLDEFLGPSKTAVILYEIERGRGHWTTVLQRPDGAIECFDSLGYAPDAELGFIPKKFQETSGQNHSWLLYLLAQYPGTLEYNEKALQKDAPGINTCGRWAVFRVANRNLTIKQFQAMVKREHIDDEAVAKIVH